LKIFKNTLKKIKTIFTYFDCDYSGHLSPSEMKKGLMNLESKLKCDGADVDFHPNDYCINLFIAYGMEGNAN